MSNAQFDQAKARALELAGEIEWADLPHAPQLSAAIERVRRRADFPARVRRMLEGMFAVTGRRAEEMSSGEPVEFAAAGMVQSAVKYVLAIEDPRIAAVRRLPLAIQFRGIAVRFIQGPLPAPLPSPAEQLRLIEASLPPGGPK